MGTCPNGSRDAQKLSPAMIGCRHVVAKSCVSGAFKAHFRVIRRSDLVVCGVERRVKQLFFVPFFQWKSMSELLCNEQHTAYIVCNKRCTEVVTNAS